jgi:hypothetical protein
MRGGLLFTFHFYFSLLLFTFYFFHTFYFLLLPYFLLFTFYFLLFTFYFLIYLTRQVSSTNYSKLMIIDSPHAYVRIRAKLFCPVPVAVFSL